jgi:hypothetical protein
MAPSKLRFTPPRAAFAALVLFVAVACSVDRSAPPDGPGAPALTAAALPTAHSSGRVDTSRSVVQHGARVQLSPVARSLPLSQLPSPTPSAEGHVEHEPMRRPRPANFGTAPGDRLHHDDPVVQSRIPVASMPATMQNFAGQGNSVGGPCGGGDCSTPPDTNGAVGPNHYVQVTNPNGTAGVAVWSKEGALLSGPTSLKALWAGYPDPDASKCATQDDGDPVVVYDQLADRWFLTQFSLPNINTPGGPSFQCVAVSQTSDPTGAYYLYDFVYKVELNDYGKFGVWPDAYYATFNMFDAEGFTGVDFCAYDRVKMLAGLPATQQCILQAVPTTQPPPCPATQPFYAFGVLPVSMDGKIPPPRGEPGFYVQFDYSQCTAPYDQIDLWTFHVDWTTHTNTTVTGPTAIDVADFTPTCYSAGGGNCLPQPGTEVTVDGLDDRMMFRFNYRNFGAFESLLVNHSVTGAANAGSGIRWYELRSPAATPTLYQQGTYAPADTNWRWMGSIAQDQAEGMALGFAITSPGAPGVADPSIAWTGRLATDPLGAMGQGESVIDEGAGVEGNAYPAADGGPGEDRGRWGDYSNMTVDPTDDCTFWYTQELYRANGIYDWDTYVASAKFPNCAANDFSVGVTPASQNVAQGGSLTYTVATTSTAGAAETIAL